jgi:hypothetical protein
MGRETDGKGARVGEEMEEGDAGGMRERGGHSITFL